MSEDISELFARDPLKHSDKDIDVIIAKLREGRAQFNIDAKAPKAKATKEPKVKIDLKDLEI